MSDFPTLKICDCDPFEARYDFDADLSDYVCRKCGGLRPEAYDAPPADTRCPICGGSGFDETGHFCDVCGGWGVWD